MTDVERIRAWAAQVRADERACTVEQCLARLDVLLAHIDASERKPTARAVGRGESRTADQRAAGSGRGGVMIAAVYARKRG